MKKHVIICARPAAGPEPGPGHQAESGAVWASNVAATRAALRLRHERHVLLLPRYPGERRVEDVEAEHAATAVREPARVYELAPDVEHSQKGDNMEQVPYDPGLPLFMTVDCTSPHQVEHFVEVTPPGEPVDTAGEGSGTPHTYTLEGVPLNSKVRVGMDFFGNPGVPFRGSVTFSQENGTDPSEFPVDGSGTGAVDVEVILV